ncbi:hypothetical protein LEMLEM_LOCUS3925 [Lemmus lemmus]
MEVKWTFWSKNLINSGKKMGPKDNTFIWLIQPQDTEDTTMGPVWIPSARKISTWTTDMVPLDKTSSPCQQEVALENDVPSPIKFCPRTLGLY